jgi:hypothetical protein
VGLSILGHPSSPFNFQPFCYFISIQFIYCYIFNPHLPFFYNLYIYYIYIYIPHPHHHHLCFLYVPQNPSIPRKKEPPERRERKGSPFEPFDSGTSQAPSLKQTQLVICWRKAEKDLFFRRFGLIYRVYMAIQAQLCSENLGFPSCGAQDWIMENGCGGFGGLNGFSLNLQQKQQLQQHVQQLQYQQQRNQNLFFDNSFIASTLKNNTSATDNNHSHDLPMLYSQGIASQFEKQRQEIDQYIRLQV